MSAQGRVQPSRTPGRPLRLAESNFRFVCYRNPYQEMADHLGMTLESARRRAQREGWTRLPGNDGKARVGIPGDAAAQGDASGPAGRSDDRPVEVAALREALARERERADRAEAVAAVVPELREKAARAEGERDVLQEALQAAKAAAEDASRRARIAEEQAVAAHQRAAKLATVLGRVAEGLERIQKTQASTAEAVAAGKAERQAALARAEEAALRAGEAEARADEASRRAAAAEARLDHLQQLQAEAAAPPDLEAAQARAAEAERQAADARRRAEEAKRRAAAANERFDRFQSKRIAEAQEAAARATSAAEAAQIASLEAEARRPLWQRIFRRRTGRAT